MSAFIDEQRERFGVEPIPEPNECNRRLAAEAHYLLETVNDPAVTSIAIAATPPAFHVLDGLLSGALTVWMLRAATETRSVS